jgi:hypothetical protein
MSSKICAKKYRELLIVSIKFLALPPSFIEKRIQIGSGVMRNRVRNAECNLTFKVNKS